MTMSQLEKGNILAARINELKRSIEDNESMAHSIRQGCKKLTGFHFQNDWDGGAIVALKLDQQKGLELLEIAIDMMKEELEKLEKELGTL